MSDRIVLISDDTDFFDYIRLKLELRKSDELFMYAFNDIPEKLHLLENSLIIINGENSNEKTIELVKIFKGSPAIVVSYNDDETYKKKCYRAGAFDFMTILISDSEFRARIIPALGLLALLRKNKQYRDILVKNNVITKNNEVYVDYTGVLDNELEVIKKNSTRAVFGAIAPDEKNKFLFNPNLIETTILNNIRRNDILMGYAPNKYFILMYNTDLKSAEKLWNKITAKFPQKIYAGFSSVTNQSRQQLINEALNKLHTAIHNNTLNVAAVNSKVHSDLRVAGNPKPYENFKMYRQELSKKIEQIIAPVFYQIQQKYSNKLMGMIIEHRSENGGGVFYIKGKHFAGAFKISAPGYAKINIDITLQSKTENINAKRISLDIEELETGFLTDLLEQFVGEMKNME